MKRRIRHVTLALLLLVAAALLAIELTLHILIALYTPANTSSRRPAYVASDWWTEDFDREMKETHAMWKLNDDGILVASKDFHGKYLNYTNSHHNTTNQPESAPHTLWMFGSSTVVDMFVPDSMTIASNLQRLLGASYRVENMGIPSASASKSLPSLLKTDVKEGDIVVYYGGGIDMSLPYQVSRNRAAANDTICTWLQQSVPWSLLIRAACAQRVEASVTQDEIVSYHRRYVEVIRQMHDYAVGRGARFFHFIEPTARGEDMLFAANIFKEAPGTVDLTHCLDDLLASGVPVYFDEGHMNEYGDKRAAECIAAAIGR